MFRKDSRRRQPLKIGVTTRLSQLDAPTLVIAGDADVVLPEHPVAISRLIPHCRLAIIPCGHVKYLGEITTLLNGKWTQAYICSFN